MTFTANPAWWRVIEDNKIVCELCPRECHIAPGGRGFCFVRTNENGCLVLTTYGRSSGFCVDPIEKKPLNHFLPGTPVLSFGTAGCNLGCQFCQNWNISRSREMDTLAQRATPDMIIEVAKHTGSRSLAFTYNDPVSWAEYAIDIARLAQQEGIKTVAVTAGYIQAKPRAEFYRWMDAANVDLKAFSHDFYRRMCRGELDPVLEGLEYLRRETSVWLELTTLLIPGENDSSDEIGRMCDWIVDRLGCDVPVHFTAFHPAHKLLDYPSTPYVTLMRARQQAMDAGIRYAYVGNVHDFERESTYCHNCRKLIVGRDWYVLSDWHMRGNRCAYCDTIISGVFADHPGTWGAQRRSVML